MDDGGRSHFVLEVDELSHRILILRDTITNLQQTLESRQTEITNNNQLVQDAKETMSQTEHMLAVKQFTDEDISLNPDLALDHISNIKSQLISLTRTEANLTGIKPEVMESCTAIVPFTQSDEIVNTLQVWQKVFQDTLSKYHKMTSSLAFQQSKDAALKVWQNQVDQVASNLSTQPSESYQEIGEQISLGVLHRTLLIHNQQQLMVRQPSEHAHAVKNLAAKNKELLAQIDNKNIVLRNRQLLLDNFSLDQDKLAAWLRDMEREKQLLNLKYIAVKRLPSILKKIQQLLDKLPKGEKLYKQLVLVQSNLKSHFNSSVMSSTRSEVHCLQVNMIMYVNHYDVHCGMIQERLSSLKAGLLTWMDHLQRIEELSANCENLSKHIDDQLATYDAHIESLLPVLSDHVLADVQICQVI